MQEIKAEIVRHEHGTYTVHSETYNVDILDICEEIIKSLHSNSNHIGLLRLSIVLTAKVKNDDIQSITLTAMSDGKEICTKEYNLTIKEGEPNE